MKRRTFLAGLVLIFCLLAFPARQIVSAASLPVEKTQLDCAGVFRQLTQEANWLAVDCVLTGSCPGRWEKTTGLPDATKLSADPGLLYQYTLYSRAYDVAANTQTVLASAVAFTWDVSGPSVAQEHKEPRA